MFQEMGTQKKKTFTSCMYWLDSPKIIMFQNTMYFFENDSSIAEPR